ncbi:ribonuclease H-like domain-containing protein [Tanacetum coccineum]
MASQDARLSKFEADFKQQQGEMTNKIDTVLKAITDRMTGALLSDTVKNPKLTVNSTSPVLSARSYPTGDPQCSSHPLNSINAVKTCSKETNHSQRSQLQTVMEIGTRQSEELKQTIEDEFKDLHLNLPVLEVLAHAIIYNAILDKYMESLELGKNGSAFIQGEIPAKIEDPGLFTLPCILGDSKPFDTLAEDVEVHIGKLKLLNEFYVIDMKKDLETPLLVGRGFLATANAVIDYRKAKIAVGEGITRKEFMNYHFPREWEIARDAEINPFKDVLVFRRMVEFLGALPINLKGNM